MTYFHPEVGCLFPDSHYPDHHVDMRIGCTDGRLWKDRTEQEMVEDASRTGMLSTSSTFDFWYEDADNPWPSQLHQYDDGQEVYDGPVAPPVAL